MILRTAAMLAFAASMAANDAATPQKTHNNRVEYGYIQTGMRDLQFEELYPGFTESLAGTFLELEKKSATDYSILVSRQADQNLSDVYLTALPVRIVRSPAELLCDFPVSATFLTPPRPDAGTAKVLLYSYEYFVCVGEGEVTPARVLDKYFDKYGTYDRKDYDRQQYVYNNVAGKYEVRVRSVVSKEGFGGVVVTVTDSKVLEDIYRQWRDRLRKAEKEADEKL